MNEIEKAINILNNIISDTKDVAGTEEYCEAVRLGRGALEKQIPKKVAEMKISLQSHSSIIKSIYGKCPICNTVQADDNYCQYCGQKLDWSVEE